MFKQKGIGSQGKTSASHTVRAEGP